MSHFPVADDIQAQVLKGWTPICPTQPGLYAIIEPTGSLGVNPLSVQMVRPNPHGDDLICGFRQVNSFIPGTLWHRLGDIPESDMNYHA